MFTMERVDLRAISPEPAPEPEQRCYLGSISSEFKKGQLRIRVRSTGVFPSHGLILGDGLSEDQCNLSLRDLIPDYPGWPLDFRRSDIEVEIQIKAKAIKDSPKSP
jgi:hypothetical protein